MPLSLKIRREYRADYKNRPSNSISFITAVATTSDRLHSELVQILFLQAHLETDRSAFSAASGVEQAQHKSRRTALYSQLKSDTKSKVGNILAKATSHAYQLGS
jgi:hypothetical protein